MNTFRKGNLTFLVPLKCGFTAFCNSDATRTYGHVPDTDTICAVVRSPVSRLNSFFVDKFRDNLDPNNIQDCQRDIMRYYETFGVHQYRKLFKIENLVTYLESTDPEEWDAHLQPFAPEFLKHRIDHVINLDSELHSLWLFLFLDIAPKEHARYNKSSGISPNDAPAMTTMARVMKLYASDYDFLSNFQSKQTIP